MKKYMKILVILCVLALLASFTACSSKTTAQPDTQPAATEQTTDSSAGTETEDPAAEGKAYSDISLGVTIPAMMSSFCSRLANGFADGAASLGASCMIHDATVDSSAQVDALENFKISGCDGYLVHPVEAEACIATMQSAVDAGMKVGAYSEAFDDSMLTVKISNDLDAVGRQKAQPLVDWVKEHFDGKTQIAVVAVKDSATSKNGLELAGSLALIEEELPESEVVMVEYCNTEDEHYQAIENIMTAFPDIGAVLRQMEETTAAEALSSLGYTKDTSDMCLIGCDFKDASKDLMLGDSVLRASCASDIYNTAYEAGIRMVKACAGEEVEQIIDMVYITVTPDNAEEVHANLFG